MNLTFDEATHTYRLDGTVLPSVTTILKAEGFVDTSRYTEYGRDRGTKVHRAIHLYDDGELDEDSLDPALRPYLEGWIRFKQESGFEVIESEGRHASEAYQFAGTLDKLGTWKPNTPVIIDIKTGKVESWVGLQLAGYHILVDDKSHYKRFALHLREDGSYRLHEFKERSDRAVFLAALLTHQWKVKEGGKQ